MFLQLAPPLGAAEGSLAAAGTAQGSGDSLGPQPSSRPPPSASHRPPPPTSKSRMSVEPRGRPSGNLQLADPLPVEGNHPPRSAQAPGLRLRLPDQNWALSEQATFSVTTSLVLATVQQQHSGNGRSLAG